MSYKTYLVMLSVSAFGAFWLTPFAAWLARRCGAMDLPDKRKVHSRPMPRLGGVAVYLGFLLPWAGLGWMLRKNARASVILPSVLGGSFFFYLTTNTASWLYEPGYAKAAAGWLQALTTGLPGYAPTWTFYRNTLVSDLLFAAIFLACIRWSRRPAAAAAREPVEAIRQGSQS